MLDREILQDVPKKKAVGLARKQTLQNSSAAAGVAALK